MNAKPGTGTKSIRRAAPGLLLLGALAVSVPAFGGFQSTETFLPAVGRIPGKFGAQFYSTIWATNLTGGTVHFTFEFLKQGQANTSPASFSDTLSPGQTKVYENVVETKLGLTNDLGGARVTSDGEILLSERIYNQQPGDDLGATEGLFFAGVPKSFSIALGQSATIQGIDQGGSENFRYNFALVETGGGSPTVHVALYDGDGNVLGSNDYVLHPYEQIQPNVDDLAANLSTTNARITATVTAGGGSVLLAGAQVGNESQDSSGFEMSFRDDLLGGGGGGGGLSAVSHDGTLVGNGTGGSPLGVNPAAVVTSVNGLRGAVTLSAGSNVTITPSGQTLTIAASGGGGALTLPYTASISSAQTDFALFNTGSGGAIEGSVSGSGAIGVYGNSTSGPGVYGTSTSGYGVTGSSGSGGGVQGTSGVSNYPGVDGINNSSGDGVFGISSTGTGVHGVSGSGPFAIGVNGTSTNGTGVNGSSGTAHGVTGQSSATGVNGAAVFANSTATGGIALFATNNGSDATVVATNASNGDIYKGFANGGALVFRVSGGTNSVEGDAGGSNTGVSGTSSGTGIGVFGRGGVGVYGQTNGTGSNVAGYFEGNVTVTGNLSKGGGSFKIDHPLDPAGMYLSHSFVESPDMKDIYDGVVTLDETGSAVVALPDWFEALNRDFRYQLTSIGTPQPGLYVSREVEENAFAISGGAPGAKVSWQVTGIRHDAYADAHRIPVEEAKEPGDRGRYLHPELFGHAGERPIGAPRAPSPDRP